LKSPAVLPGFFLAWHCLHPIDQPLVNKISSLADGGLGQHDRPPFVKPARID
jgi:hypothetical protein